MVQVLCRNIFISPISRRSVPSAGDSIFLLLEVHIIAVWLRRNSKHTPVSIVVLYSCPSLEAAHLLAGRPTDSLICAKKHAETTALLLL